jgi:hypothetical protein
MMLINFVLGKFHVVITGGRKFDLSMKQIDGLEYWTVSPIEIYIKKKISSTGSINRFKIIVAKPKGKKSFGKPKSKW